MRRIWTVLAALATLSLTNCGYNAIQSNDEQVKSSWSEVVNQYQRRADLVPNLVNSVKGFAQQEKDVLLVVTKNYPQRKSDALFRDLMAQLEGTENRITVARNRYIKAVQDYNVHVRSFPSNLTAMMFGYKIKANFSVENEKASSTPPRVEFGTHPGAPQPSGAQ